MNREQFEGSWRLLKGKIKQKWNKLTDEDIAQINGKFDLLMAKLHKRYGFSREQAERELNSWRMEMGGAWGHEKEENRSMGHEGSEKRWEDKANWEKKEPKTQAWGEEKQDWKKKHGEDEHKDKKRKAG